MPGLPAAEGGVAGEVAKPAAPRPATQRPAPDQVVLAVVAGAHGIGGEVKLKLFSDGLAGFTAFNGGGLTLLSLRGAGVARFKEVADRTAAEQLRGTFLTVPRSALPPLEDGEYYHADLIGLPVVTSAGEPVGHVAEVENFGAGDVIEIEKPDGKRFMAPMTPTAVPEWNAERLVIDPEFVG